jgi:hypothetical protein
VLGCLEAILAKIVPPWEGMEMSLDLKGLAGQGLKIFSGKFNLKIVYITKYWL